MSVVRDIIRAVRMALVLWALTAIIYPAVMLVIGQLFFPYQANGSLVQNLEGKVVGSVLIGQPFTTDQYFWSRPSAVGYSTAAPNHTHSKVLKTGVSGASNLAPSNSELLQQVQARVARLKQANVQPVADLVYASGSGLDPNITVEAALAQVNRVARARNLSVDQITPLIAKHIQGRFLGIFGEPGVNVLQLNRDLDNVSQVNQSG